MGAESTSGLLGVKSNLQGPSGFMKGDPLPLQLFSAQGVEVLRALVPGTERILTPEALGFIGGLNRMFRARVQQLILARSLRQEQLDKGMKLDFLAQSRAIRESEWTVAPLPAELMDRRVEITGPVDRKMIINALNSGASVFLADFEDANAPTWENTLQGQVNLQDAVRRTIEYTAPETGKQYTLKSKTAVLFVRPRGWHLPEAHILVDGTPALGALVDFGLYFFFNAAELLKRGTGPYFYLPKLESHLEARVWNEVFLVSQAMLGIPFGKIKATVLIETLPAAFEMHEILWELAEHSAGLNCGRWDYMFSAIKKHRNSAEWVMPDRSQVSMLQPFLRAYTQLLIQTCHKREVHAMGGMAAQIPIRNDSAASAAALEKVRADKLREVGDGHDGTWVAHPGLVPIALEIFNQHMPQANQLAKKRQEVNVTAQDLLAIPKGTRSLEGLKHNVLVGIQYLEAWIGGQGCVPLYNLMEDAATAEICRTQIWQWVRHGAQLEDGQIVTPELVRQVVEEELVAIRKEVGDARFEQGNFQRARELFEQVSLAPTFVEFLTLPAYQMLVGLE